MRMQRDARKHTTLRAQAGVNSEEYADFKVRQRVHTVDGYPGRIVAVHDGPYPGTETYEVELDGGMGGGQYLASQLSAVGEGEYTASKDYPELAEILVERPDPGKQVVLARKTARKTASTLPDDHPDKVWLRFGHWPDDERSINNVMGWKEDGVSAYDLDHDGDPIDPDAGLNRWHEHDEHCEPDCDLDQWNEDYSNDTGEEMRGRVQRAERNRYRGSDLPGETGHLVKGTFAGVGHDGEPLLHNVRRVGDWIDHRHLFIPTASPHRLARHPAEDDYEEPQETPPGGHQQRLYSRHATTINGTEVDDHGEAPHRLRAEDPNSYDAESTEGDPGSIMYAPLSERDKKGAEGGELMKNPGGVSTGSLVVPALLSEAISRKEFEDSFGADVRAAEHPLAAEPDWGGSQVDDPYFSVTHSVEPEVPAVERERRGQTPLHMLNQLRTAINVNEPSHGYTEADDDGFRWPLGRDEYGDEEIDESSSPYCTHCDEHHWPEDGHDPEVQERLDNEGPRNYSHDYTKFCGPACQDGYETDRAMGIGTHHIFEVGEAEHDDPHGVGKFVDPHSENPYEQPVGRRDAPQYEYRDPSAEGRCHYCRAKLPHMEPVRIQHGPEHPSGGSQHPSGHENYAGPTLSTEEEHRKPLDRARSMPLHTLSSKGVSCYYKHDGPCPTIGDVRKQAMPSKKYSEPDGFNYTIEPDQTGRVSASTHHLHAFIGPHHVGTLSFSKSDDGRAVKVDLLHALDTMARVKGVGSAMMDKLYAEHPDAWINHGTRTDQGIRWWSQYEDPSPAQNVHNYPPESGWDEYFNPHSVHLDMSGNNFMDPQNNPEPKFDPKKYPERNDGHKQFPMPYDLIGPHWGTKSWEHQYGQKAHTAAHDDDLNDTLFPGGQAWDRWYDVAPEYDPEDLQEDAQRVGEQGGRTRGDEQRREQAAGSTEDYELTPRRRDLISLNSKEAKTFWDDRLPEIHKEHAETNEPQRIIKRMRRVGHPDKEGYAYLGDGGAWCPECKKGRERLGEDTSDMWPISWGDLSRSADPSHGERCSDCDDELIPPRPHPPCGDSDCPSSLADVLHGTSDERSPMDEYVLDNWRGREHEYDKNTPTHLEEYGQNWHGEDHFNSTLAEKHEQAREIKQREQASQSAEHQINQLFSGPEFEQHRKFLEDNGKGPTHYSSKTAAELDPADLARTLDKAREHAESEHADDLTYVPDWEPLHKALPPEEHNGWMFMERQKPLHHEYGHAVDPIYTYKHGLTRKYLHLDDDGRVHTVEGWRGDTPFVKRLDKSAPEHLRDQGHYSDLERMGWSASTPWNHDTQAEVARRLKDHGIDMIISKRLNDPYRLVSLAATDPELRFHFTASWADVRAKAKRIRSEGKVRITLATTGMVIGEVEGDHHTYETGIQRFPNKKLSVAGWSCGCKWAAYHWGAADDFSRFAGRMCSHALALQFEAQSRGMFGAEVEIDRSKPDWVPPKVVVKYDIDSGTNSFARSSSKQARSLETPLETFRAWAFLQGESQESVDLLLRTAGLIEGAVNSPFGEPEPESIPKPYGATSPHNPFESPASAGFLSAPDPDDWAQLDPTGMKAMSSYEGDEATLHPEPEPALPSTDGQREDLIGQDDELSPEDESIQTIGNQMGGNDAILDEALHDNDDDESGIADVVAAFQATAAAQAIMSGPQSSGGYSDADIAAQAKLALKQFTDAEQRELINEGMDVRASNLDRLDIAGTHYADLEDEEEPGWML